MTFEWESKLRTIACIKHTHDPSVVPQVGPTATRRRIECHEPNRNVDPGTPGTPRNPDSNPGPPERKRALTVYLHNFMTRWSILILIWICTTGGFAWAQGVQPPQQQPLQWQRLADMPLGVFDAGLSVSGDRIVITGGITQAGAASKLVQVFDLKTHQWEQPLEMPQGLSMHGQVTLADGRVLVVGGCTGQLPRALKMVADAYLIDLTTGEVQTLKPLWAPIRYPSAHLLPDGRAMIVGGGVARLFDPHTHKWCGAIKLRQRRRGHSALMLPDGRVIVAGGMNTNSIEVIDPNTEGGGISRMLRARLPFPLDDLKMTQLADGRLWIVGGQSSLNGNTTDQSWVLDISDPQVSRIEEGPRLGIAGGVADHCLVTVGPWAVVAGGEAQQTKHDIELVSARLLDRRSLAVWSLPLLNQAHDDSVAIAHGRQVIIFGGYLTKEMSFPKLPGMSRLGKNSNKSKLSKTKTSDKNAPTISVPFASAAVEMLTLPVQIDAPGAVTHRHPQAITDDHDRVSDSGTTQASR